MPHEPIIRWIALGLLGLGVAWIIIEAIGLRPRAIRVRRAIRRSGSASLLCGSCGHPAVSLGAIDTCPECGALYAAVGLDGAGTISRWAPPVLVCTLVLLGAWLLGSATLAPAAARWANQKSIGAPMVSSDRTLSALAPRGSGVGPHARPPLAIEIDATLVRPRDPMVSLVPPPLPGSTITVRAAAGPAVAGAEPIWSAASAQSPYATMAGLRIHSSSVALGSSAPSRAVPPSTPAPLVSPWDALFAAAGPHELTLDPVTTRWTLRDPAGATLQRGSGVEAGALALLEAIGITPGSRTGTMTPDEAWAEGALRALSALLADPTNSRTHLNWAGGQPLSPPEFAIRNAALEYAGIPSLAQPTRVSALHPSAPWGLTAAIATWALLLLVAIVVLAIAWRSRRRARRSVAAG